MIRGGIFSGKTIEIEWISPKQTLSIWSWIYWYFDEPAGWKNDLCWYRYAGSNHRRQFVRILGFSFEETYGRD